MSPPDHTVATMPLSWADIHRDGRILASILAELPPFDGSGWLVVDDLVDTGATLQVLRAMLPKAHFATLYAKPKGQPLVDTFATVFPQTTWISFPWDPPGKGS